MAQAPSLQLGEPECFGRRPSFRRPAAFQTCGGRLAESLQVWRPGLPARSERTPSMLWKGFQRPKRLEFERETLTGSVRPVLRAAI